MLLDHASGSRRLIDEALVLHGVQLRGAAAGGYPTTGFRMVEQGIGISVMPALAMPPMGLPALAVRPLLPKVKRSIMLVHRRNRAPAPLAQRVWALIREMALQRGA